MTTPSSYPVSYDQQVVTDRNRLTTFLRMFMVIPHMILGSFYGFAAGVVVLCAWFAVVFTGRFPQGMYDFVAGYLRFIGRVTGYYLLVTDVFPPFDGGEHPEYPVRIGVAPAAATYSRAKAFFRGILAIPLLFIAMALGLWAYLVAIALWFVIVFTGRSSPGLLESMRTPMAYIVRANAYLNLVTETYPPLDPGQGALPAGPPQGGGTPLPGHTLSRAPEYPAR